MFRQVLPRYRLFAFALLLAFPGIAAADTPAVIGEVKTYTAHAEDTFAALAQKYNIGYVALIAANPGIDPWLPGEGTKIILPTEYIVPPGLNGASSHEGPPHEGIVVNVGELRLFYYAQPNGTPQSFAIGIGREGKETPLGQTTIVRKTANPVWYPTVNTRADKPELPAAVPAGDDNPLGAYALYLGWPSYLIHGTNNPQGVGRQASRGCMRLYPDSIQELFERVPVGTKVTVIDQPVSFARANGKFYMSIFPSRTQIDELEDHNSMTPQAPPGLTQMILAAAGSDTSRLDWNKIRVAADARSGYPVDITKDEEAGEPVTGKPVADVPILPGAAGPALNIAVTKNSETQAPENETPAETIQTVKTETAPVREISIVDAPSVPAAPSEVIVIPDTSAAYDAYNSKLESQTLEIPEKIIPPIADDTSDLNQGQLQKLGKEEGSSGDVDRKDIQSGSVESRP